MFPAEKDICGSHVLFRALSVLLSEQRRAGVLAGLDSKHESGTRRPTRDERGGFLVERDVGTRD